jgi:DNA-binding MarR family transcriptional regulator
MARPSEFDMDYQPLADFRYEIRRFLNFSEQAARSAGIEPQQHQMLLAIKGLPADRRPTIGVIAERLQLQHHSAAELASRLQAKGLLQRKREAADRREVLLMLTPPGERLLRELSFPHRAELRSAGPTLLRALEAVIRGDRSARRSRSRLAQAARRNNHRSKRES